MQDTESSQELSHGACITCFNPFDPMQDTESKAAANANAIDGPFQPIRSDAGY